MMSTKPRPHIFDLVTHTPNSVKSNYMGGAWTHVNMEYDKGLQEWTHQSDGKTIVTSPCFLKRRQRNLDLG